VRKECAKICTPFHLYAAPLAGSPQKMAIKKILRKKGHQIKHHSVHWARNKKVGIPQKQAKPERGTINMS
jgi:hypothetical protein